MAWLLALSPVAAQTVGFLDSSYDPRTGPDGTVLGAALEGTTNRLLIGGDFDNFGTLPRAAVTVLRANGLVDAAFDPGSGVNSPSSIDAPSPGRIDDLSRPGSKRSVQAGTFAPDGKIVLGGNFLHYDNVPVTHLVRLNADGSLDLTFRPDPVIPVDSQVIFPNIPAPGGSTTIETTTNVESVLVAADLSVYVAYRVFRKTTVVIPSPSSTTVTEEIFSDFIHFERDGALDPLFRVVIDGNIPLIYRAGIQPDGKLLISGRFINVNGFPRPGIARLNADGTIDGSFSPTTGVLPELIYNFVRQPDGKFIVVGDFSSFDSALRRRIARIFPDGTVDPTYDPGFAANGAIRQVAVVPSTGKVVFAGDFTLFDGLARPGFARTDAGGKIDTIFNSAGELSGRNFAINAILPQNDGKVVVAGDFRQYGSVARNRILRLTADPVSGGGGGSSGGTNSTARLSNVSTRGFVGTGDSALIGGFLVTSSTKRVLIRSMGPTLASFGVSNALSDPTLELRDAFGTLVAQNNNWQSGTDGGAAVRDAGLAPADPREAALVADLAPGIYTVVVRGSGNTTGVALFEAYDVDGLVANRLSNLSTRGQVLTNDRVLIGGFAVTADTGTDNRRVLIRGMGPTLASYGVSGTLSDPVLEIYDSAGNLIGRNDNWQDSQRADIVATGFQPQDSREAAVLLLLPSGNYTAVLRGVSGSIGVGLVEVYEVR